MSRILVLGNATLDIINFVDRYPQEDQEVRAHAQQITRGGNAANTASVLSQLGHQCSWAGTLADEPGGELIRQDLVQRGIELGAVYTVSGGKVPTSYVTLSQLNGSRTIVHYRDLPEYPSAQFINTIRLLDYDWLHVEGRNLDELETMLRHTRHIAPDLPISLEAEKMRDGIEVLFPLADVLMFSSDYAKGKGVASAAEFLGQMRHHQRNNIMTCTWGEQGAFSLDRDGTLRHAPAYAPSRVVDTLGAGDVFNAGLIDQLVAGSKLETALVAASRLAGKKCGRYGLDNLL